MSYDWEPPKEKVGGPTRQPEGCLAQPPFLAAPGTLLGVWWPLPVPPFAYKTPRGQKPLKRSCFHETPPPRCGNLTEEKFHLRRGDSAGEVTSRKGRSLPSSSSSSRASSRSLSRSSPTSAPSPSTSNLISQLQLLL